MFNALKDAYNSLTFQESCTTDPWQVACIPEILLGYEKKPTPFHYATLREFISNADQEFANKIYQILVTELHDKPGWREVYDIYGGLIYSISKSSGLKYPTSTSCPPAFTTCKFDGRGRVMGMGCGGHDIIEWDTTGGNVYEEAIASFYRAQFSITQSIKPTFKFYFSKTYEYFEEEMLKAIVKSHI